jgi:hypothetical protein
MASSGRTEWIKADMAATGFVLMGEGAVLQRSEDTHDKAFSTLRSTATQADSC